MVHDTQRDTQDVTLQETLTTPERRSDLPRESHHYLQEPLGCPRNMWDTAHPCGPDQHPVPVQFGDLRLRKVARCGAGAFLVVRAVGRSPPQPGLWEPSQLPFHRWLVCQSMTYNQSLRALALN